MVTEDYVSFETAKLLKEKGFDEPCLSYFWSEGIDISYTETPFTQNNMYEGQILRPTLQMVMKWLREVHHIFIDIDWNARPEPEGFGNKPYFSLITNMNTNEFYSGKDLPGECASYEEACESAIKYCLENLI